MILAHGHDHVEGISHWFGMYHFLFLHFPIAAALLAAIAELLFIWKKDPNYAFTARFLLWMTFFFAIPTVAAGLTLAEEHTIRFGDELWFHRLFGIGTLILSGFTAILSGTEKRRLYLWCFAALIVFVCQTGFLGGLMSFPGFQWLPM